MDERPGNEILRSSDRGSHVASGDCDTCVILYRLMKNKQQPPRSTSWGRVAGWYEQNVEKDESYHATLLLPNLLRLISVKKGERMVELGCGSGFFCERFAAFGAEMVGVDLSKELIAIAQQRAQKQNLTIRYHAGSAEKLGMIAEKSIDTTVIVLAIQNMRDIRAIFAECSRVLKKMVVLCS